MQMGELVWTFSAVKGTRHQQKKANDEVILAQIVVPWWHCHRRKGDPVSTAPLWISKLLANHRVANTVFHRHAMQGSQSDNLANKIENYCTIPNEFSNWHQPKNSPLADNPTLGARNLFLDALQLSWNINFAPAHQIHFYKRGPRLAVYIVLQFIA